MKGKKYITWIVLALFLASLIYVFIKKVYPLIKK